MIEVGKINSKIISLLGLNISVDTPIYLGESNINHMITSHQNDYVDYGSDLSNIILNPDYVGLNSSDNSIEYVKEFLVNNDFVKVAVRISTNGKYFARSIYRLNNNRVNNFIKNGSLKKY